MLVRRRARHRSPRAVSTTAACTSTRTIRSRASRSRRTRRRRSPTRSGRCTKCRTTCSSRRLQAVGHAREEHQHDRRGAGLELVHEPDRHDAGHRRRARARPQSRRPTRPVALGADPGEDVRRPSGLHGEGCARARPGSSSSIPRTSRKGRPAAVAVATKIFWALGYNQVESFLTTFDPKHVEIDPKATIRRPSGARTPFTQDDINAILERVARNADGTYRVIAGRLIPGKILGGFLYDGTRPDDPNDVVPHEHRRELRALRVFGAWTNLTDLKAANTLDTLVTENGRSVVKHYLQDVGSTFGMCNDLHEWDLSWEHFYQGDTTRSAPLLLRLRAEPVADGRLRRIPVDRQVRGRSLRSQNVAAADADDGLPGVARRRRVLGGATGRGVHRRADQGGGPHRRVQRSRRRRNTSPTC